MPIDRVNFDELVETDLKELIDASVPEGLRIEYKRETYGNSDSEKREALKDISAFANSHGGHLIIGVTDNNGVATSLSGIDGCDIDAEILRLEQLIRTGIEPRILSIRIMPILLKSGTHVIVIRVPHSWNLPHRVCAQNSNRFWIRNSCGVHEASMEELRNLFTLTSDVFDKIRNFRIDRIKMITEERWQRPLFNNGRLILHIVPLSAFSSHEKIELENASATHKMFSPIGSMGMTPRFNFDGFINERGGEFNYGYTQIFRNGIIEATKANIVIEREGIRFIPGKSIEEQLFQILPSFIDGLRQINVSPPLVILLSFEGVEGVKYIVSRDELINEPIDRPLLLLPECILEEFGTEHDYHRAVKPAFDALWNAVGYSHCMFYNNDGVWVGEFQQR